MDNISLSSSVLVTLLIPFLSRLLEGDGDSHDEGSSLYAWEIAKTAWDIIKPEIDKKPFLKEAFLEAAKNPYKEDSLAALRFQLKKLMTQEQPLSDKLVSLWMKEGFLKTDFSREFTAEKWLDVLDSQDETLRRLEMIRLLRIGVPPEKVAQQFNRDIEYPYRLNASFSLNGIPGILPDSGVRNWFDNLNKDDPIIRRLEMIRLLRSGTPLQTISRQYNALPEYILRLHDRFSQFGVTGILTEDDFQRFRSIHPQVIRIFTYNLHGTHTNNGLRFRRIAKELSNFDPHLGAFQEVIGSDSPENTGARIAEWMSRMTGYFYRTHYVLSHLFMDKFPEGLSILARHDLKNPQRIDLTHGLDGRIPRLQRYAIASEVEIYEQKIIFVNVHLDHEDQKIRLAQAEKLLRELDRLFEKKQGYCYVVVGDFNDVEDSPAMIFLRKKGFKDAFRNLHASGGNTFDSSNPHKRIDYIMIKGDVNFISAELILKDPDLSDHIGVFATIEIKRPG